MVHFGEAPLPNFIISAQTRHFASCILHFTFYNRCAQHPTFRIPNFEFRIIIADRRSRHSPLLIPNSSLGNGVSCKITSRKRNLQIKSACIGINVNYFACEIKSVNNFTFHSFRVNFGNAYAT